MPSTHCPLSKPICWSLTPMCPRVKTKPHLGWRAAGLLLLLLALATVGAVAGGLLGFARTPEVSLLGNRNRGRGGVTGRSGPEWL